VCACHTSLPVCSEMEEARKRTIQDLRYWFDSIPHFLSFSPSDHVYYFFFSPSTLTCRIPKECQISGFLASTLSNNRIELNVKELTRLHNLFSGNSFKLVLPEGPNHQGNMSCGKGKNEFRFQNLTYWKRIHFK
jgi:hypothetical protein